MPTCTFFGHRDCPGTVRQTLYEKVIDLIQNLSVDLFYIGCQGSFDALAQSCVEEAAASFLLIRYYIVLERMPTAKDPSVDYSHTLFPEGIERIHPRFAIVYRNRWILKRADYVISYVTRALGGADRFTLLALRQGKAVFPIP